MDKSKLTAPRAKTAHGFPEDDVELPGIGTVRVRGLSRAEVFEVRRESDSAAFERRMLAAALVDPAMSEDEVGQWQRVALGGEMRPVVDAVLRLSAMSDGAPKSGLPGDGDRPGS